MEGKNWDEFKNYKCRLENRCNKVFIRCHKTFTEEKSKKTYKNT